MIVLDTNVLSELTRPAPSLQVIRWMGGEPSSNLFTTAITRAEILYGLELMPRGKRRAALESAVQTMFVRYFPSRILPFDAEASQAFASIAAARRAMGHPISPWDGQIAAIALSHGAQLATRNVRDFERCGVALVNPWEVR